MARRILVTGGAGYIGSHAVLALLEAGHQVLTVDNLSNGHRDAVLGGEFTEVDLLDVAALDHAFGSFRPDAVLHFAGAIEVGESMRDPLKYFRINVGGSLNLLAAMRRHGTEAIVFSSTAAVFGTPVRVPIEEADAKAPINPYGESKLMVERVLGELARAHGLKACALRYLNAAGADPSGRLAERHEPESHLIPLVLRTAAGSRLEIAIFGTDYDTPDGTCLRDYVHVSDLIEAHLLALDALFAGRSRPAYNLGNGEGYSVRQVIETARRVTGWAIPAREAARRPGDPAREAAAPTRHLQAPDNR
ncbi:MAG: UDP-glucose 4-epimerase GalE [Alphaproteobacteria bacterium]|nr:UDP-glucose 4-epimerase GalE [Alphaproteobacteria bacterium]